MKKIAAFIFALLVAGCTIGCNHTVEEQMPQITTSASVQTTAEEASGTSEAKIIKIACVGDSLTWGQALNNTRSDAPYPKVLQELLGEDFQIENFGASGRVLSDGYSDDVMTDRSYSKTKNYQDSLAYGADIVVICLGTNDAWKCDLTTESGRQNLADSLVRMVQSYESAGAKAVFVCLPPFSENTGIENNLKQYVRPILEEQIEKNNWKSIDLFAQTEGEGEYLLTDGVHMQNKGYALLAELVCQAIIIHSPY